MKVRTQNVAPRAARLFTDREEPRAAFWQNYEQFRQEIIGGEANIHVLNYYGIGGIGKSRLLKQLASEMEEKLPAPRYVYFDFNVAQERRAVLTALKNKLTERYHFQFPLFDLCSYVYARGVGEDAASPEVKKLADGSPVLSLLLSVAENIPIVGIGAKVLSLADQGLASLRSYLKLHQRDLTWLESQDPEDLYAKLPAFFAQDLNHNLEGADQPLVLFLDTYERLVNEMSSVGAPLNHDQWLRDANGPVQNTLNTLWVIAGREKLKWAQLDSDWEDALETHILGSLSPTDSDRFLYAAGVGGKQLRGELYGLTSGTPVYLDLCVDQYLRLTQQGIVPDITMFGQNTYDLIERFVRYMDDRLKDIVYVMAFLERWDDRTLTDIAARVLPNFSLITYEKVKEFSFVIQSDEDTFNIHQTVGDVLATYCPKALKETIVKRALNHFLRKIGNESSLSPDFAHDLRQITRFALLHHQYDIYFTLFFLGQIKDRLLSLAERNHAEASDIFSLVWGRTLLSADPRLFAGTVLFHPLLAVKAYDYKRAMQLALVAEQVLAGYYDDSAREELHRYTVSFCAKYAYQLGYWHLAEVLLTQVLAGYRALNKGPDDYGNYFDDIFSTKELLAFCYHESARYEEALVLYDQLIDQTTHRWTSFHNNLLLSQKADVLLALGRCEEAHPLFEQVAEYWNSHLGDSHPRTTSARIDIALSLSVLGRHEEALARIRQVYDSEKKLLNGLRPADPSTMEAMAFILCEQGETEAALSLYRQAYSVGKQLFNRDDPRLSGAAWLLVTALTNAGRYEEAYPLCKELLEWYRTHLTEHHPYFEDTRMLFISILERLGKEDEALAARAQDLSARSSSAPSGPGSALRDLLRCPADDPLPEQMLTWQRTHPAEDYYSISEERLKDILKGLDHSKRSIPAHPPSIETRLRLLERARRP